jgi:hypothetical protein
MFPGMAEMVEGVNKLTEANTFQELDGDTTYAGGTA